MMYRLNAKQIKTEAQGNWIKILTTCGLDVTPRGKSWHVTCPICGDDGCFRIDDKDVNKTYLCKCSQGDGINLIQRAMNISFYDALKMVSNAMNGNGRNMPYTQVKTPKPTSATDNKGNQEKLNRTLYYSKRTPTKDALDYYSSRGITIMNKRHGFVSYGYQWYMGRKLVDHYGNATRHHVILPKISLFDSPTVGVTRIYTDMGKVKNLITKGETPNKPVLMGKKEKGAGIWFTSKPMDELHIAEGYENGLSIANALGCMNVVCGNTAAGLKNLIIPDCAKIMHIWMDSGQAGMNAARTLYARYKNKKTIRWHIPPSGIDWNDILINEGNEGVLSFISRN